MLLCMESVYVVGGCNVVARKGMFLVGSCSWLALVHGYEVSSNRMLSNSPVRFGRRYVGCMRKG